MKSANDVAVELQAKFDYFIATAILASIGFSIQINFVFEKFAFILYVLSLIFFSSSAIFCFYRLQQKPHIYQLHSNYEKLILLGNDSDSLAIKKAINGFEKRYETSYFLMMMTFFFGALMIALTKLSIIFFQVF